MTLADYRKLAGIETGRAVQVQAQAQLSASPPAAPSDGIPTLTPEQFAVLTGQPLPSAGATEAVQPQPTDLSAPASDSALGDASAGGIPLTSDTFGPSEAGIAGVPSESADGVPAVDPALVDDASGTLPENTAATDTATAESGDPADTGAAEETDGRIVWLTSYPDREEQKQIAAQGKTWRLKETPGARELFLGPDGKFGWDDFIDIINPLQHIPVVAQVYRAVTGDEAYALSNFIGAAPFGPLSVANAVVDTVIRGQTGRDAGTDLAAQVLGIDRREPEEANLKLAMDANDQAASAAPAAETGPVQVAELTPAMINSAWTRDMAGVTRD